MYKFKKNTQGLVRQSEDAFWLFGKLIWSDKHSCSKSLFSSHCKSIKLMSRAALSGWYQLPVQGLTSCHLAGKSGSNGGADATLKCKTKTGSLHVSCTLEPQWKRSDRYICWWTAPTASLHLRTASTALQAVLVCFMILSCDLPEMPKVFGQGFSSVDCCYAGQSKVMQLWKMSKSCPLQDRKHRREHSDTDWSSNTHHSCEQQRQQHQSGQRM